MLLRAIERKFKGKVQIDIKVNHLSDTKRKQEMETVAKYQKDGWGYPKSIEWIQNERWRRKNASWHELKEDIKNHAHEYIDFLNQVLQASQGYC